MKRFILLCSFVCAQLTLMNTQLFATQLTPQQYAEFGIAPPQVTQEEIDNPSNRGWLSIDSDVEDTSTDIYLGTQPQNKTKYPIVLLHGFLGWDQVFFLDYFYHIRKALQEEGFVVYAPQVNPVASVETRAKQLAPLLDQILKETGAPKLNLIAHSMGGLDARWLIGHGYEDKVASLTMIGTPNHGTPVSELVFNVFGTKNPLYKAFEFVACAILGKGQYKPSDMNLSENLRSLSVDYVENEFNPSYPDSPNIYYQSYAGVSSVAGFKTGDVLDVIFVPFLPAFKLGERNDGLVPEQSAIWGRFRGIFSADHANLIGQLFGKTAKRFDHVKFYKKIAWELVDMGY